eukprot:Platyproteum_vivax@DN885_c0_g1_i1.p1
MAFIDKMQGEYKRAFIHGILIKGFNKELVMEAHNSMAKSGGVSWAKVLKDYACIYFFSDPKAAVTSPSKEHYTVSLEEISEKLTNRLEYTRAAVAPLFNLMSFEPKMSFYEGKVTFAIHSITSPNEDVGVEGVFTTIVKKYSHFFYAKLVEAEAHLKLHERTRGIGPNRPVPLSEQKIDRPFSKPVRLYSYPEADGKVVASKWNRGLNPVGVQTVEVVSKAVNAECQAKRHKLPYKDDGVAFISLRIKSRDRPEEPWANPNTALYVVKIEDMEQPQKFHGIYWNDWKPVLSLLQGGMHLETLSQEINHEAKTTAKYLVIKFTKEYKDRMRRITDVAGFVRHPLVTMKLRYYKIKDRESGPKLIIEVRLPEVLPEAYVTFTKVIAGDLREHLMRILSGRKSPQDIDILIRQDMKDTLYETLH